MSVKTIAVLKSYFETGDVPTEQQFADLIDSFIHKTTGFVVTNKSYDEETGDVSITLSDNSVLAFNIKPDLTQIEQDIDDLQNNKVDKVAGKGLSTNDFTNELKDKLENLVPYTPPTSHEIAFINGLQEALDLKALDSEVVKSVNGILPDPAGNVEIEITPPTPAAYDLQLLEAKLNYTYFGEDVYGVLLQVPAPEVDGSYIFAHALDIAIYVKMEQREEAFLDVDAEPTPIDTIVLSSPLAVDLLKVVKEYDSVNGIITVTKDDITVEGYVFPTNYVYLEYVKNVPVTEGIGLDTIGVSAIGEGF